MDVKHLVEELRGKLPIAALQRLNESIEASSEPSVVVRQVVAASGDCRDVLALLTSHKLTASEIAVVFTTLSHVLLNIASDAKEYVSSGTHITEEVVHTHAEALYQLLAPSSLNKNTRAALQCLTGMVLISPRTASEVLTHLNWSKINLNVLLSRRETGVERDVRAWCVYFLMAFLNVKADTGLAQRFLEKPELFSSVFPGLMFDPCETVLNVLKVIKDSILFNQGVNKTTKMDLFTPVTVQPLFQLYNWSGPAGRLGSTAVIMENNMSEEFQAEKAQVKEQLQRVLLVLLTSIKFGIVFQEKMFSYRDRKYREGEIKSNNWYIMKIIANLEQPWKGEEETALVVQVLRTCPDLLVSFFESIMLALDPESQNFESAMKLTMKIIEDQHPWKRLDSKGLGGVKVSLLPQPLGEQFFRSIMIHKSENVKLFGLRLMATILRKTRETLAHLELHCGSSHVFAEHRRSILSNIYMHFGTLSGIIIYWRDVSKAKSDEENPVGLQTLIVLLKVLILCQELYPSTVNDSSISPVHLLKFARDLARDDAGQGDKDAMLEFQVLCIEFFSGSQSSFSIVADNISTDSKKEKDIEQTVLYQLICMYCQVKNGYLREEENSDVSNNQFQEKCLGLISKILRNSGLSAREEFNLSMWLEPISDDIPELSVFLTRVLHQAASCLSQYTQLLVDLAATGTEGLPNLLDLEHMEVEDNEDVSGLSASLSFSRLVPAAMEVLTASSEPLGINYFSSVMNDYIHFIKDPVFLAKYLLQQPDIITENFKLYLDCWTLEMDSPGKPTELSENAKLSDILKHLFMYRDWSKVEGLLTEECLKKLVTNSDVFTTVRQILAYVSLILINKEKRSGKKLVETFTGLLRLMVKVLGEMDPSQARLVVDTVLKRPVILDNYDPFLPSHHPQLGLLAQEFISAAHAAHTDLSPLTRPYFTKLLKGLKEALIQADDTTDFLTPINAFISSPHVELSYASLEEMFAMTLKYSSSESPSLSAATAALMKVLLQVTNVKRQPDSQTVDLMLKKYLEWCKVGPAGEGGMKGFLEDLLVKVMTKTNAENLTTGELKTLMGSECSKLCCRLVALYPPLATPMVKRIKKAKVLVPSQAPLLEVLMSQQECEAPVTSLLTHNTEQLKEWVLALKTGEGLNILYALALKLNIFDETTLGEICTNIYQHVESNKDPVAKEILSLLPAFTALANTQVSLPLATTHLNLVHVCMACIKALYRKKEGVQHELVEFTKWLRDAVPLVEAKVLREILSGSKLWPSFVKQILKNSLNDVEVGPVLLDTLTALVGVVYGAPPTQDHLLPPTTLYQMLMSHSQYLQLMFNHDLEWHLLRERVVALQQAVVECDAGVCQERHVPVLLGAYGATMAPVDQRIFKLLYTYERGGHMGVIQPVLWGEAAVSHFGIHGDTFAPPSPHHVLALVDKTKLLLTLRKFNTTMPLEPKEIQEGDHSVYDLRFLLSLMVYVGRQDVEEIDFAESGAVAIGFTAMTSHDNDVWAAGAAVLKRMVEKMEQCGKHRLKLPWLWLVGVVSCSFNHKKRRIPPLTAEFLVRASALMTQPRHRMYSTVLHYLFLRPAINQNEVPELFRLYNSDDPENHEVHRSFLVSLLASGVREPVDYILCRNRAVPSMLLSMLHSPTTHTQLKVKTLRAVRAMVGVNVGAVELLKHYSILTVLQSLVLEATEDSDQASLTEEVLQVMSVLWDTLVTSLTTPHGKRKEVEEEEGNQKKRKRETDDDTKQTKTPRMDGPTNDEEKMDEEITEEKMEAEGQSKKVLPRLVVREFLNCLFQISAAALKSDTPQTVAVFVGLVAGVLDYAAHQTTANTQDLRAIPIDPHFIKHQIKRNLDWGTLVARVHGRMSDEEEVEVVGADEAQRRAWVSAPLHTTTATPHTATDDVIGLSSAVAKLSRMLKV